MNDDFIKICRAEEIPEKSGRRFRLDDENEIALFRVGDCFYAVDNVCPHNHTTQMYKGDIVDNCVICPVHGYRFNLISGKQPDKEGCSLRVFELRVSDGFIHVRKPAGKRFDFRF